MKFINLFCNIKQINKINSYILGIRAEKQAIKYLKKAGYSILKHNFKTKIGEIDIIALKKDILVAIEVKNRKNKEILPYVIKTTQQKRITKAFLLYLQKNQKYQNNTLRFDVILIHNNKIINHIENAWNT